MATMALMDGIQPQVLPQAEESTSPLRKLLQVLNSVVIS